jgi:pilus assembly protein FimV
MPAVQAGSVKTKTGQTEVVNPEAQPKPAQPPVNQSIIQAESAATSSSNTYNLWVSGVGAGTLSILGWLWWRKRKLEEATNIHSLFASSNTSKTPEYKDYSSTLLEKESTTKVDAVGTSSLFSEFTFHDFDTFDTDQGEIDPVSEADVYLAYGRYQQAEELMRDVIKDQPGRDEYKLKLLEIFYSNENKQAFEAYAHELAAAGKKDDVDFWTRVTEMGSEICKESTLFSTGVDDFSPENNSIFINNIANRLDSNVIKMKNESNSNVTNFSPSFFKESLNNEAVKETPQKKDSLLDNDLTTFEVGDEQQNHESIDYDLTTIVTDVSAELNKADKNVTSNNTQEIQGNNEFDSFEFDLGSNDSDTKDNDESNLTLLDGTADDNYQHTDFLTDKSNGLNYSFDNNFFNEDFDHDFERPSVRLNGQNFDQQDKFEVFDLTDMDQLETKLDLAKAYIDMSDADAAKDMAWEVLKNGTVEQKKIAQALLNDLE